MLEPSVDSLQEKINSKYTLVTIAARRARNLQDDAKTVLEKPKALTYVGIALEEIFSEKLFLKETK